MKVNPTNFPTAAGVPREALPRSGAVVPQPPAVRVAEPGDARGGPLGVRRLRPEFQALFSKLAAGGSGGSAASAAAGIDLPVPEEEKSVVQPMPEIPEPPMKSVEGADAMPAPGDDDLSVGNPNDFIAQSGAESRVVGIQADPEWGNIVRARSGKGRREFFDRHRCQPINWDNMLQHSFEITQEVLVWTKPKKLSVVFRTMTGDDEFLFRDYMREHYGLTDTMLLYGNVVLAAALGCKSIGDLALPGVGVPGTANLEQRRDAIARRVNIVSRLPYMLLADLAINYSWFIMRVIRANKDGERGELGNG